MGEGLTKSLTQENPTKRGFIKQVLSGDSLTLQIPTPPGNPPNELTVYLAYVNSPRMGKRPTENANAMPQLMRFKIMLFVLILCEIQPYAWEAREFLRRKVVGQTITFVREFIATSGQEHGFVYLGGTGIENAENITESGVSAGLLEVKPGKHSDGSVKKLLDLQELAKLAKKGRWSEDEASKHIRDIKWKIDVPRALVDKYSGKQIDAVVEQVRDGSTICVFLLPSFEYITIVLSGVKAPSVKAGTEGKSEDYGEEAKFFVETRLLQRDVKVCLLGESNQNIWASVFHPTRGNIAEFLLKNGLARFNWNWSMGKKPSDEGKLRAAESYAKQKRLGLWQNFAAQTLNTNKENQDEPKQITFSKIDAKSECDMKSRLLNRNRIGSTPAAPNPLPNCSIKEKMLTDPNKTLELARKEVEEGQWQQGSEKGWLAVDIQLKQIAAEANFILLSHDIKTVLLNFIADKIAERESKANKWNKMKEIKGLWGAAKELHENFYECWLSKKDIYNNIKQCKELIDILANFVLTDSLAKEFIIHCENYQSRKIIVTKEDGKTYFEAANPFAKDKK